MKRNLVKNIQILLLIRKILLFAGVLFTIGIGLSFTTLPYWGLHWLGTSRSVMKWKPVYIILLGGSGMPSESNLIRSWYTAGAAAALPECRVVVVMPGDTADRTSTPRLMESELILRGVTSGRILLENRGTNTRSQVLACAGWMDLNSSVLLVTSPENMRRTVLCFRKAGFLKINALPAFENAAEADFSFDDDELGGNRTILPDVGHSMQVRYQIWTHLKYEIMIIRELTALFYYGLRGWI